MSDVIAFGDSVMKGVVLENDKYKICSDNFINICSEKFGITTENLAKFGNTVGRGIGVIEKNLEKIKNDSSIKYVILEFGGNDCDFNWAEISENPEISHLPNTNISTFCDSLKNIADKIKNTGKIPVLLSLPPIDSEKYFKKLSENLNADNIFKWLGSRVSRISDWHERYNLGVFNTAYENNIKLIDITSPILEHPDAPSLLCSDGIHPNKYGHKIIADTIIQYVTKHNKIF